MICTNSVTWKSWEDLPIEINENIYFFLKTVSKTFNLASSLNFPGCLLVVYIKHKNFKLLPRDDFNLNVSIQTNSYWAKQNKKLDLSKLL